MTIWRMRFACWITKAIHTHTKYVILIAFPLQQWLQERVSLLRYTYIACLINLYDCLVSFISCVCCILPRMVVCFVNDGLGNGVKVSVAARFNISGTVVTVCSLCFNIHKLYTFLTHHIYVFHIILTVGRNFLSRLH
jgi:hypothetical protein